MSDEDRRKWDAKHAAVAHADAGHPAFLAWADRFLPAPAPDDVVHGARQGFAPIGRALDVACGRGGNAVRLAERGWLVEAVDVSVIALTATRMLAASRHVGLLVRTLLADLDDGLPEDLAPHDLVLCSRFHAPALWPALRATLAPGGLLLLEALSTANRGPDAPCAAYLADPATFRDAADGLDLLACEEAEEDGRAFVRLAARKPRVAAEEGRQRRPRRAQEHPAGGER